MKPFFVLLSLIATVTQYGCTVTPTGSSGGVTKKVPLNKEASIPVSSPAKPAQPPEKALPPPAPQPDTQLVEVIGVGETPDAARKHALFTAVEQVVGAIVDASIDVRNNDVIQERILTLSDGYIEDFTVLEPARRVGNLFHERIRASVRRTRLLSSIAEQNVSVRAAVRGELLYAQAVTQDRVREQALDIIKALLSEDPRQIKAEINGQPERVDPLTLSSEALQVSHYWMRVPIRIYADDSYYNETIVPKLTAVLDVIASSKERSVERNKYDVKNEIGWKPGGRRWGFSTFNHFEAPESGIAPIVPILLGPLFGNMAPPEEEYKKISTMVASNPPVLASDITYRNMLVSISLDSFNLISTHDLGRNRYSTTLASYLLAPFYLDSLRSNLPAADGPLLVDHDRIAPRNYGLLLLECIGPSGDILAEYKSFYFFDSFWQAHPSISSHLDIYAGMRMKNSYVKVFQGGGNWYMARVIGKDMSFSAYFPVTQAFLAQIAEYRLSITTDNAKIREKTHASNLNGSDELLKLVEPHLQYFGSSEKGKNIRELFY